ncbi:FHA domain-containing protein [Egibacter rhizosphaerae]|uniref:FHA domain-containing protein n=1 Tax=Egibacter rhizosphaerae TaxID=1670831 RepID=A0A411YFV2_9ACTN|nr:FHA domain-containing protein [Egibacter rhizosphaerae]QBI19982.1 FHA domain-containing protein [Egibacter rhizosphaerae]
MPQVVLTLLQGVFLLFFYLFVWRAMRAILRDVNQATRQQARQATGGAQQSSARPAAAPSGRRAPAGQTASGGQPAPRGRQASGTPPRELVVHRPDAAPAVVPLNGRELTFGRGEHATVRIVDSYASDRHARLAHDGQAWVLQDLGSTNGTFVNRQKIAQPTPIYAGDQLGIGRTVVEVRK